MKTNIARNASHGCLALLLLLQASALASSSNDAVAVEKGDVSVEKAYLRDPSLKQVYDSLEHVQADEALAKLARLIQSKAKSGLKDPSDRLIMTRLLTLAAYGFIVDENILAATNLCRTAVAISPDDVTALCYLSHCYRAILDFKNYKKLVARIEKMPKTVETYQVLIRYAKFCGKDALCNQYIEEAEKLDPKRKNLSLQIVIARHRINEGFGERALERFNSAASCTVNDYCREIMQADAALMVMDSGGQETHLRAAGKIYPYDTIWRVKLSDFCMLHGKEGEGIDLLQEALNCKRYCGHAWSSGIRYLKDKGRFEEALNAVQRMEQLNFPTAGSLCLRAEISLSKGDPVKGRQYYNQAIELNPYASSSYEGLISSYSAANLTGDAVTQARRYIKAFPTSFRAHLTLANTLFLDGKEDEATKEALVGLSLLPKVETDEYGIPLEVNKIDLTGQAVKPLVSGLNLYAAQQAARAKAILGAKQYKDKNFEEAKKNARFFNFMKFNPELPSYLTLFVLRPGRLNFEPKLGDKDPAIHVALADMLFELRRFDECIQEYRKASALDPDNSDVNSCLLHVISQTGDWGAAAKENIALSQKIINKVPNFFGGGDKKK